MAEARTLAVPTRRAWADVRVRLAVIVGAIVAVYLATRLALVWRFPPFTDESLYAKWTFDGFHDVHQRFISLTTQVEPGLMWLGMTVMKLGAGPFTAIRLVSFFAGICSALIGGLIARRLGGDAVGLSAAGLYVVTPFFFVHDVIGILDPLLTATAMLALYLQLRLAERPRLDIALLLGIVLGAGLLTKETGLYAVFLLPASLLMFDWSARDRMRRLLLWLGGAVLALVVAWALFSVTKLSQWYTPLITSSGNSRVTRTAGTALSRPFHWLSVNWPNFGSALWGYVTGPLLVLAIIGVVLAARRRPRLTILLVLWFAFPFFGALLLALSQYARYMLSAMPPLVIFAAYGLVAAVNWARPRVARIAFGTYALAALVFLALLPALTLDYRVLQNPATAKYPGLDDWQYATGWPSGAPWAPLADELRRRATAGPITLALGDLYSNALLLDLRNDHGITLIGPGDPRAAQADYAVENSVPLPRFAGVRLVPVWTYSRPRHGPPVTLYALER